MTTNRLSMLLCMVLWSGACATAEAPAAEATPMPAEATQGDEAPPAPEASAAPVETAPATPAAQPAAPMPKPTGGVVVLSKVKDYDAWKQSFDLGNQVRKDAGGFMGHGVGRVVDDPKGVLVWLPTTDLEKAKTFTESPELKKRMKDAGVIGLPRISMLSIIESSGPHDAAAKYGALITHRVKDYDAWKPVFDEHAAKRAEASILSHSVNQDPTNSKLVHVWVQATDLEKLKAFFESKDLKGAMKAAGVRGPPTITIVELVDMKMYQ